MILITQLLNKLAGTLASAKLVLPWLMSSIGAPTFLTGLLVPIRESGSLLPQVLIGGKIQQFELRKVWYIVGVTIQALCIGLIALVAILKSAMSISGLFAGSFIIGLLVCFSFARGVCSLTSKDILGKTIPEKNRGRLIGLSASLAGLISIGMGITSRLFRDPSFDQSMLSQLPVFAPKEFESH